MLSQNGWTALDNYGGPLIMTAIPGTSCRYLGGLLNGDVNTIAMYCGHRWNTEIEPLQQDHGLWGYNLRTIRGSTTSVSNHSSGTAWDTMATNHPLGTRTMSGRQLSTLAQIVTACRNVIRSGAFYTGRPDEMHIECFAGPAAIATVAADIRAGKLPNTHPSLVTNPNTRKPTPAPAPTPTPKEWYEMPLDQQTKDEIAKVVFEQIGNFFGVSGISLSPHALEDVRAVTAAGAQAAVLDVVHKEGVGLTPQMINLVADAIAARLGK